MTTENTFTRDTNINGELAERILSANGREDEFIPDAQYWLAWDHENREYLVLDGEIIAENYGTTSWSSPGY